MSMLTRIYNNRKEENYNMIESRHVTFRVDTVSMARATALDKLCWSPLWHLIFNIGARRDYRRCRMSASMIYLAFFLSLSLSQTQPKKNKSSRTLLRCELGALSR